VYALNAVILVSGWNWFIAPWAHLSDMPFLVACGVWGASRLFSPLSMSDPDLEYSFNTRIMYRVMYLLILLLLLWVLHLQM
jgi:hypothetical protein